jgi:plastocyanin
MNRLIESLENSMLSMRLVAVSAILASAIACGGYSSSSLSPTPSPTPAATPAGPSSTVVIPVGAQSLANRAFMPDELDVAVGTTVVWTNSDSIAHTSTSDGPGWNSGTVAPGRQFSFEFKDAGTFPYHCTIHPGMVGTVVVR